MMNHTTDKNGATIRTGDVVAISGGYFKNSNGFFLVTACPGDPTWSGRDIALHRIGKGGKLSERNDSVSFWPLTSYCSNREKAAEAKRWNAEHAEIEVVSLENMADAVRYFREKAEQNEQSAERSARNWGDDSIYAQTSREYAAHYAAVAARITAAHPESAEQPAEQAPEKSIRFYWNGVKVDGGSLIRCFYSLDNNRDHSPSVSISCSDYSAKLPADLFTVRNDTDLMTDYFDTDRATLTPEHPLYKFARYAAECAEIRHLQNSTKRLAENIEKNPRFYARDDYYKNDLRQQQERLEHLKKHKNPGQPTAADLEAVAALNSAAESARIAAKHAQQLAEREKMLAARNAGRVFIEQTAQQHPIQDGGPTVEICWSEHPAFSSWEDGELVLSVAAAEIILKHYDEQRAAENAESGCGGYDKTKFLIHYTDESGEAGTYEGRYDLGDNDGGLIAHIRSFAETTTGEDAQNILHVASMLEKFTKPGREAAESTQNSGNIVHVEVSPLLEQAAARVQERRKQAEQETEEIMESLNLLTDEQLARAVLLTDPKNPDQANVGRVFLQKLDARDHQKAMELYRYWQTGGAA